MAMRDYAPLSATSMATALKCVDPVCARLAMCLMDKDVRMGSYHGKDKGWWCQKAVKHFSSGFCRPPQGDVGEIFVALYMLFCGDVLRARFHVREGAMQDMGELFNWFSVSLYDWIDVLVNGGTSSRPMTDHHDDTMECAQPNVGTFLGSTKFDINFIQICRNYLRFDGPELFNEYELEQMYLCGTAYYVYQGCKTIDLFASIRCTDSNKKKVHYVPLLISVKSAFDDLGETTIAKHLDKMTTMVEDAGYETGLCILVRIGNDPKTGERTSSNKFLSNADADLSNGIVSKLLVIPNTDSFGVWDAFTSLTSVRDELAELYVSHRSLVSHAERKKVIMKNALRQTYRTAYEKQKAIDGVDEPLKYLENFVKMWRKRHRRHTSSLSPLSTTTSDLSKVNSNVVEDSAMAER